MPDTTRPYDVVLITDCRLPGGTAASAAEEIAAQQRRGYRTALIHVDSPLVAEPRPFNPRLARLVERGAVDLLVDRQPVAARLAVVRHPGVLRTDPLPLPEIDADRVLLVANQTPRDAGGQVVHYEPGEIAQIARERLGAVPTWAPIGPQVREQLAAVAPEAELTEQDWFNVIDVDAWAVPRDLPVGSRPVIGRHSRDDRHKWPASRDELVAAYPIDGSVEVRVLGGAEHALRMIGRVPASWTPYAFGAIPPERFLADIDFFVYFHHPDWVEAFGRTTLEAMASGAVAILPHHFAGLFGDAAIYAEPSEVRGIVERLHADRAAYLEQSSRGQRLVRERFGHEAHHERLERLIGPPSGETPQRPAVSPVGRLRTRSQGDQRQRVLFVSSNGAGVGHLMRLMSMARRADDEIAPLFLSLSQAVSVVREQGFCAEYLASRGFSGMAVPPWHRLLRERIGELVRQHDVRALVFDGTWPYRGLLEAIEDHPRLRSVWSRRGMWRAEVDSPMLDAADRFDLVVEPGEFAQAYDRGPTARRREQDRPVRVGPVTFLDREELADPGEARAALGLDPDRPAALVQLGAGNINDVSSLLGAVTDRLVAEGDLQVCVTRSIIADQAQGLEAEVIPITGVYPLARYFRAFDFAIAAAGYNSVHEALVAGLPTVFVPNLQTSADDQGGRAAYAHDAGVGLHLPDPTPEAIDEAVRVMRDPERREAMAGAAAERMPANGAADAMRAVERLIGLDVAPAASPDTGDLGDPPERPASPAPAATASRGSGATDAGRRRQVILPVEEDPAAASMPWTGPRGQYRRVTASLSSWAQSPDVRRRVGPVFHTLPAPVRATVRRRLRRWERGSRLVGGTEPPRIPVPAGGLLPAGETERPLPGTLFLLPHPLSDEEHERLVTRIGRLQVARREFAPLVVTFRDDLAPYRRTGLVPEVIPGPEAWSLIGPADAWPAMVRARLEHLIALYDLRAVVPLGEVAGIAPAELGPLALDLLPVR